MAAAQNFGLIRKQGDRYELTTRGEALFSEEMQTASQARREAVMSTNFGRIIYMLRGREASDRTIAARLRDDFQVPGEASERLASILLASAEQATLVTDGRFDVSAIEHHQDVVPSGDLTVRPSAPPRVSGHGRASEVSKAKAGSTHKPATGDARVGRRKEQSEHQEVSQSEDPLGVQVVLQIDAAKLGVDDTLRLLKALRVVETDHSSP
jgi:hypothetical protein